MIAKFSSQNINIIGENFRFSTSIWVVGFLKHRFYINFVFLVEFDQNTSRKIKKSKQDKKKLIQMVILNRDS